VSEKGEREREGKKGVVRERSELKKKRVCVSEWRERKKKKRG
jgi:hypothetical protein